MAAVPLATLSSALRVPNTEAAPRPSATILRFCRVRALTPVAPDPREGRAVARRANPDLAAAWLVCLALAIVTFVVS